MPGPRGGGPRGGHGPGGPRGGHGPGGPGGMGRGPMGPGGMGHGPMGPGPMPPHHHYGRRPYRRGFGCSGCLMPVLGGVGIIAMLLSMIF